MHFRHQPTMNPDQTAPKETSDLGPYCLQYMLPTYVRQIREQPILAKGLDRET